MITVADLTPSEELRQAAARIREVVGKATPGPWLADPTGTVVAAADLVPDDRGGEILPFQGPSEVAECYRSEQPGERAGNAKHVGMWHPGIAELVAGVLEANVIWWHRIEEQNNQSGIRTRVLPNANETAVLNLARAINSTAGAEIPA